MSLCDFDPVQLNAETGFFGHLNEADRDLQQLFGKPLYSARFRTYQSPLPMQSETINAYTSNEELINS